MPTTYAHYKFGKEVLSALPRPLQNSIEAHRELFDIGLHGTGFWTRVRFPPGPLFNESVKTSK